MWARTKWSGKDFAVSVLQYCLYLLTHLTVATVLIEHIVLWRAVSDKVINISHNKKTI